MDRAPASGLVVSGLAQVALGALAGIPYAIATYKPQLLSHLRVQAPHRVRQLHLDLVMMGGLVAVTGVAVPRVPRVVAVGCWTNALASAPPAIKPSIENSPAFRALVAASFVTTSTSWLAVAAIAARRWRAAAIARGGNRKAA